MKIQYCSDLHLEFRENKEFLRSNPLQPKGEILLLAGDIVPFAVMETHADFFDYVADNFETTYWLPGNHEYYSSDIAEYHDLQVKPIRSNVFLLNNTVIEMPKIRFVFSTLWSHISQLNQWVIQQHISDFHLIKFYNERFLPQHFNELHDICLSFLKGELNSSYNGKTVVVTHHIPTLKNYPMKFQNSILNEAFAVELSDFIENLRIDYWIFGHHHYNCDAFILGNSNMCTNQLGYLRNNENVGFNTESYFEVDDFDIQINKVNFA
jgi:predicted phosphohydrolase